MKPLLEFLSSASTPFIAGLGVIHLLAFVLLWLWYRLNLRRLSNALNDFTRPLRTRSDLGRGAHRSDQIAAFLADVREVFDSSRHTSDQLALWQRIRILDEKRPYLSSLRFETCYTVLRSMIEAYPLLGILGTILAIGLVVLEGQAVNAGAIVERFGQAIWSTCAGLVVAVVLMFFNSLVETAFERLAEHQAAVRDTVGRVKRVMSLAVGEPE